MASEDEKASTRKSRGKPHCPSNTYRGFYCEARCVSQNGQITCAKSSHSLGLQRSNATLTETLRDQAGSDHSALWPFIQDYLSPAHRDNRADGCTVASLASEAARQDEQVQASFAQDQEDMPASVRERAIQLLSELVGAIILARSVAQANLSLSDEILEAVSTGLQTQMKQTTTMNQ